MPSLQRVVSALSICLSLGLRIEREDDKVGFIGLGLGLGLGLGPGLGLGVSL